MRSGELAVALGGLLLSGLLVGACAGSGVPTSREPSESAAPSAPHAPTPSASPTASASPSAPPTAEPTPTPSPARQVAPGETAWVDVAVATGWRNPQAVRDVDVPALEDPVRVRDWLAAMSEDDIGGLIGAADSQLLLGEPVEVVDVQGSWAQVVVPDQPSPLDLRGYPLWIPMVQLTAAPPPGSDEVATVVVPTAWLRSADGTPAMEVSFGTHLPVLGREASGVKVALPDGSPMWIELEAVAVAAPGTSPLPATPAAVVASARAFIGLPYLWAGTSGFGFDCSGLVHRVYEAHGVLLPRDAGPQATVGIAVERQELEPADLVFFARDGAVHHVAIYVGDGQVLEAPYIGATVRVMELSALPYAAEYAGARRVVGQ